MNRTIAIIGPGRMGAGLGLALHRSGHRVALLGRRRRAGPAGMGDVLAVEGWDEVLDGAPVVLVAVPDDAITMVARQLAAGGRVGSSHIVLHLSGLLDRGALAPLEPTRAALGSMHPLIAIPDSAAAPDRFPGAWTAVEGDARAIVCGESLATAVGMQPFRLPAGAKAAYHAAAAMASNFSVAVFDAALRIAADAGIEADAARRIYAPLLRGTAENLAAAAPADALTGAIRRGDADTVAAHLGAISDPTLREAYVTLAELTVRLAERAGLPPDAAGRVREVLAR